MATGQDLTGLDLVNLNGATTTVTNTYKTTSAGTYGTQAYAITPGTGVTVANAGAAGNTYNVSGLTFYATGLKCDDAHYAASGNSVSLTLGSKSGYTTSGYTASAGTLSGSENPYTLTMPGSNVTISAASCTANALTTDGSGNYLINNTDDWNAFCAHVEFGNAISGATVKLTDDISVTTMAGSYTSDDDYHPFSGTFDGDGHTLTLNVSKQGRFAAPFKCVKDATIKNLHTAGTINGTGNSDGKLLAGIVGVSFGNTTITGCRSSMTLTTNFGEDAAMAGIVAGTKGGSLTIAGCVFDGTMTGSTNTRCAGIAGYEYIATTTVISNTLFAPTTLTVSTADDSYTKNFTRDDAPTITNCYYTDSLGTAQGTEAIAVTTAPDNLGSLVEDYGMVKTYQNGILVGGTYYVAPASITLADNADNNTTINDANGYFADVTLSGRTLYKDGDWNTLCLPFDVTISGSVLDGAVVKTLSSSDYDSKTGTLTLNFTESLTEIEAGKPYIVKWNGDGTQNIVSPIFEGVTISSTATTETDGSGWVDFVGTYKPTVIYENGSEKHNLYLGSSNKLYYPTRENFMVNACRAYFRLKNGLTAGEPSTPQQPQARAFVLNFGDGEPSAISTLRADTAPAADGTYTLDGRRLTGKPTAKGLYIVNGKKIIIK